jgi:hypothetical protein
MLGRAGVFFYKMKKGVIHFNNWENEAPGVNRIIIAGGYWNELVILYAVVKHNRSLW